MRADQLPSPEKPPDDACTERAFTTDMVAVDTLDGAMAPPPPWRRSTRCGPNHTCVEVAPLGHRTVGVRDSVPAGPGPLPVLRFSPAEWLTFIDRVKDSRPHR